MREKKEKLAELSNLYNVSINAIKEYKHDDPIDIVYMFMWLEEQFQFYKLNFDNANIKYNPYNMNIQKGLAEWKKMKEKRENKEISTVKYIEWKLNCEINNEIN